ncbi:MAG: Bacterial alpha-L-rhamnosidase [Caldilineaceae bacterium SB0661_bin_32]|uniref:alpha-L-rhamnosidase n=1 Tax=Caldilineaceae bacterium SB0661_bin_32 TaxID=2605255 RepID=A0A6B1D211_9CHLR|nr:Bacterial alpha-L-rhamnosidase [Caldilineaceae bacterium SB0661_bin_32]
MITPTDLNCEYAPNPINIDTLQPRFGWLLQSDHRSQSQSAYQILVASSVEDLQAGRADKWDSGKVISDRSVNVPYGGNSLSSDEICYWQVRVWDQDDRASAYSEPAAFTMGLLEESDWTGTWIGAPTDVASPLLRTEFDLASPVSRARLHISGLGWYELYLNGQRVGDHVLDPATSDYTQRVLYVTYDVTELLQTGANAVGVMLGNGWYCEPGWEHRYGDSPRLRLQLNVEFADGSTTSVASGSGWKTAPGPITRNDLYGGETYDARLEQPGWAATGFDDAHWDPALDKDAPGGKMVAQVMPPIRVNKSLQPVNVSQPQDGIHVYDLGQLFGGWAKLRLKGERGTKVTIKYACQVLEESGLVDQESGEFYFRHRSRASAHEEGDEIDIYILKGDPDGESYEPRFTYHPVRYVQVESDRPISIEDLQGHVVYSDVDLSGGFECSNPIFNRIHELVHWTVTNGLFGIPLDCLHREHWAWTDPATIASSLYPRKHMPRFWTKWLDDIKDAQLENGEVPDICPNYVQRDDPDPAWGGNYPILVWYLYQYFDDSRILEEHYAPIRLWVDYLTSVAENHIVNEGHYGDHMLPGAAPGEEEFVSSETPPPLLWTGYYYLGAAIVSKVADYLGKEDEAARYARLAEEIKDALNREWLDPAAHRYATGSQTANLFPLALGIVPPASEAGVVQDIVHNIVDTWGGHHHTGNTGVTCLIDALTPHGQGEVLYDLVATPSYPGWGFMVEQGATTIWESWSLQSTVGAAESMIMWASIDEFFYNDLAGIKGPDYHGPGFMAPGFSEIHIEPHPLGDLEHAGATLKTVRGELASHWRRTDCSFSLEVTIPINSAARVSVPTLGLSNISVSEGGNAIWQDNAYLPGRDGIISAVVRDEYIDVEVGSGSYRFELTGS